MVDEQSPMDPFSGAEMLQAANVRRGRRRDSRRRERKRKEQQRGAGRRGTDAALISRARKEERKRGERGSSSITSRKQIEGDGRRGNGEEERERERRARAERRGEEERWKTHKMCVPAGESREQNREQSISVRSEMRCAAQSAPRDSALHWS